MLHLLKYYSSATMLNLFKYVTKNQPSSAEEDLENGDYTGGLCANLTVIKPRM
jgi:hypothetical protein